MSDQQSWFARSVEAAVKAGPEEAPGSANERAKRSRAEDGRLLMKAGAAAPGKSSVFKQKRVAPLPRMEPGVGTFRPAAG